MSENTTSVNLSLDIVLIWFLGMVNGQVWYGTTSVVTQLSTWASWVWWGQMIATVLGGVAFILMIILIISGIGILISLIGGDSP